MPAGRIVGMWFTIAGLLLVNGLIGRGLLDPVIGRDAGEMMSFFVALIIIGAARPFLVEAPELATGVAVRIGILWMVLTVFLEVGIGRLLTFALPTRAPSYGMLDGAFAPLVALSAGMAPILWLRRSPLAIPRITK